MVQATGFHRGKRFRAADIDGTREMCPVRHSSQRCRHTFRVQRTRWILGSTTGKRTVARTT